MFILALCLFGIIALWVFYRSIHLDAQSLKEIRQKMMAIRERGS